MIYILSSRRNRYDEDKMKIIYITTNINNIYDLFKENKITKDEKSYDYLIEKFDVNNTNVKKYHIFGTREEYYVDINKKIIMDQNDKIIFSFNSENNDKYNELMNEKQKLAIKCEELWRKKEIPKLIDNYFHIVYDIKNSNENLEENIDYLMSVLLELESYPDKKN